MLILVMGVTGSGKTSLGKRLAARVRLPFFDADDFHPPANKEKMAANVALDDGDRLPWLARMAEESRKWEADGGAVLACSALKASYRALLLGRVQQARIVFLEVARAEVTRRLEARRGSHGFVRDFDRLLDGQFRDLEPPSNAIVIPSRIGIAEAVERAASRLAAEGLRAGKLRSVREDRNAGLSNESRTEALAEFCESLGSPRRVLILPAHAEPAEPGADEACAALFELLNRRAEVRLLGALGEGERGDSSAFSRRFPRIPSDRFMLHDFATGLASFGDVPASYVHHLSAGRLNYPVACRLDSEVASGRWDRIVSVSAIAPHDVLGLANHSQNLLLGAGSRESNDRTRLLGAAIGTESILGRADTPPLDLLNFMAHQLAVDLPVSYLCTVGRKLGDGSHVTHGLYAGDDAACFQRGAPLAQALSIERLGAPAPKVVVYLNPLAYRSTWSGNRAICRARLAVADGGELVLVAPGIGRFGEDPRTDRLIRRHGYHGLAQTLAAAERDPELASQLSVAAHLIQGDSEGRFRVTLAPGSLTPQEVEPVGFGYAPLAPLLERYGPGSLSNGHVSFADGEAAYFIADPSAGVWTARSEPSADPVPI